MSNQRNNIILFGPPGIGKSTILKKLSSLGYPTLDLEDVYPDKLRFKLPNYLHHTFIGAADLDPKLHYSHGTKILLTLEQSAYEARRDNRDKHVPGKSNQSHHLISDWLKGAHYDYVLNADGGILDRLIKIFGKYN